MSEVQTAPNLQLLEDRYEVLGELRSSARARAYMAKRRDDGSDVIISVAAAPQSGENNALNHFAADTQLLSKLSHPQMPRIVEGRWVGKDQFAVVSERHPGSTLDELLARGEKFSPPRIAAILQDVNTVLEWARSNGVVHRGVSTESLSFERDTNRVLVSLEPTPVPVEGVPDACADASTLGTLAWAMLAGKQYTDGQSLAELRPDLAKRVVDETDTMVRCKSGGHVPDVLTYVAVVAAADALRTGELEIAEMQAQITEARRAELAQFEADQKAAADRNAELEAQLANQRTEFERKMADEEAQLVAIKAEFAALKASEESQLSVERGQFDQERQDLERERLAFEQKVAEREAELNAKHAAVDRLRAEEGQRIDAAIAAAVETVAATAVAPPIDGDPSEAWKSASVSPDPKAWVDETVRKHSVGTGEQTVVLGRTASRGRPGWALPIAATALVLVLVALFAATHHKGTSSHVVAVGKSTVVPTAPTTAVLGTPQGGFMTQSAGGSVAAPVGPPLAPNSGATARAGAAGANPATASAPATTQPAKLDSAALAAKRKSAISNATAKPKPKPKPVVHRNAIDSSSAGGAFSAEQDAIRRADAARRDSAARRDTTPKRKPDTTAKTGPDTTGVATRG